MKTLWEKIVDRILILQKSHILMIWNLWFLGRRYKHVCDKTLEDEKTLLNFQIIFIVMSYCTDLHISSFQFYLNTFDKQKGTYINTQLYTYRLILRRTICFSLLICFLCSLLQNTVLMPRIIFLLMM